MNGVNFVIRFEVPKELIDDADHYELMRSSTRAVALRKFQEVYVGGYVNPDNITIGLNYMYDDILRDCRIYHGNAHMSFRDIALAILSNIRDKERIRWVFE